MLPAKAHVRQQPGECELIRVDCAAPFESLSRPGLIAVLALPDRQILVGTADGTLLLFDARRDACPLLGRAPQLALGRGHVLHGHVERGLQGGAQLRR